MSKKRKQRRDHTFRIRVNRDEWAAIRAAAKSEGLKKSEWARRLMADAANELLSRR